MKEKILGICGAVAAFAICMAGLFSQPVAATDNYSMTILAAPNACGGDFLGLKPWYDGLCNTTTKEIVSVCEKDSCPSGSVSIQKFVWRVVLNVIFDITLMIGYIALAMVIYGGYLYIMAQGDAARVMRGKKTLTAAVIGVVIGVGASVFVNTGVQILGIDVNAGLEQATFTVEKLNNIVSWAYMMAGIVAVVFIIKSGIEYMTAIGDTNKTSKATHGLIYSTIGLVIVILAAVITSFVIKAVGGAM